MATLEPPAEPAEETEGAGAGESSAGAGPRGWGRRWARADRGPWAGAGGGRRGGGLSAGRGWRRRPGGEAWVGALSKQRLHMPAEKPQAARAFAALRRKALPSTNQPVRGAERSPRASSAPGRVGEAGGRQPRGRYKGKKTSARWASFLVQAL